MVGMKSSTISGMRTLIASLLLTALGASPSQGQAGGDPTALPIPVVDRGEEKFLQTELSFGPSGVSALSTKVGRGFFRSPVGDPPLLLIEVFDDQGNLVDSYNSWHPQWSHVDEPDGSESLQILNEGVGAFRCDFEPDLQSLVVTDRTGEEPQQVADVDLRPAIRSFCEAEPLDPDCERSDLAIQDVSLLAAPDLTPLGVPFLVDVRTTFANQGPSTPIDATLRKSATPGMGVEVSPLTSSQDELGLALDVSEFDDQTYEVSCAEPGASTLNFESSIELLTVAATDPDPNNNEGTLLFGLDCLVPVTLIVKPRSSPNPISLKSKRVPVAVLTTVAGEDGNPLAFDATQILVGSVRVGTADALIAGAGSGESHGKLHPKDVREPDAKKGDGDVDALLHFDVAGSGLATTSDEVWVLGAYTLESGENARFFGCDSVVIVPR
jgi:hypothetical protein